MHRTTYRALSSASSSRGRFALLLFTFFTTQLFSQGITSSPYSRYGLGEVQDRSLAPQAAMGGMGYAATSDTTSPFFINLLNPASYTGIRITAFDAGVRSNTSRISTEGTSLVQNNTSLGYIVLGLPIGKRGGASVGLLPFSGVGYNLTSSDTNSFGVNEKFSYEGSGGLNQFYIGGASRLLPSRFTKKGTDLSLGVNGSYIFGTINNTRRVIYTAPNHFNTRITEATTVSDFTADLGLQFSFVKDSVKVTHYDSLHNRIMPFKKDIEDVKFTFGFTFGLPSALDAERNNLAQTYTLSSLGLEMFRDTIANEAGIKGKVKLPLSLGGGFAVKKGERWLIGADYTMQQWSNVTLFGENPKLNNSMKASIGMQYVPKKSIDSKDNYFKRVHYRAGVQYKQTFLELKSTQLNEYSFSVGLGLPLRLVKVGPQYTHSMVNIALEIGQRGTMENDLIKEQFVRGLVSFTLNDRWFIKRRFD